MSKARFNVPTAKNEPVRFYEPGTQDRKNLQKTLQDLKSKCPEIPMNIGGKEYTSDKKAPIQSPHELKTTLAYYYLCNEEHVHLAIDEALKTKEKWASMPWEERAAIFLKAADLVSGPYRNRLNAATMLGQSKNAHQSEIDAVCELADFLRFNVEYMTRIYEEQPMSTPAVWNRLEYRPLEGFVIAITPFNFTAIAGNLPTAPAMMGNVVIWKPSLKSVYSSAIIMDILREAGLPDGVINMVFDDGPLFANECLDHPMLAGVHFTGSTTVFKGIWEKVGTNIRKYKSYPRIVGETGGKDYILAHRSAKAAQLSTAIIRGAFEFQGQKCSAASRAYIPSNLWPELKELLKKQLKTVKMGSVEDFTNFVNAVISEQSFDKLAGVIDKARNDSSVEIVAGGNYDKSEGYFIEPTVLKVSDPHYYTMQEELFGPIISIYVYNEMGFENAIKLVDGTSMYGLTGAVFAKDRSIIQMASKKLSDSAGNFYINDKPTGSVVGQQPFGGSRGSGTNDKAGSIYNLLRWVSPRSIKENFVTPTDYMYPTFQRE